MTYRHTPEMGEISGFGGTYEDACQDMLEAGVNWLVAEQAKRPLDVQMSTYKGIYGILEAESDDAKALEMAVMKPVEGKGASGPMHHAVMSRLHYIAANGWDAYCAEILKGDGE